MPTGPRPGAAGLDVLRRAARSARHRARRRGHEGPAAPPPRYDAWLQHVAGAQLAALDAALADPAAAAAPDRLTRFRGLDSDLWALLLTREFDGYPHVRAALPGLPPRAMQEQWNGTSGLGLAVQTAAFHRRLTARYAQHGPVALDQATVLDFGCGWGRLTRMLARDVPPGRLHGCDPSEAALDACRATGVPARLARSDFLPGRVPFDASFDLAFAFSVFTHLSERAHEHCLAALHAALRPGGLLIVTVRPPAYLDQTPLMAPARRAVAPDEAAYVFVPHAADPGHPQYGGGQMDYGETVVTLPYVRERWGDRFELLEADLLLDDLFQVVLTLRRRPEPAA